MKRTDFLEGAGAVTVPVAGAGVRRMHHPGVRSILDTGTPTWTFRVEGNRHSPRGELQRGPALHGGVPYVGSRDRYLHALDLAALP